MAKARKSKSPPSYDEGRMLAIEMLRACGERGADYAECFAKAVAALNRAGSPEANAGFDEVIVGGKAFLWNNGHAPEWEGGEHWAAVYVAMRKVRDAAIAAGDAKRAADSAAALQYLATEYHRQTYWTHAVHAVTVLSETNRTSARLPRKPVSKAQLERFRKKYIREKKRERGWKKAACLRFKITDKTLTKKMTE